jgi:Family of unknown function (DUF6069)
VRNFGKEDAMATTALDRATERRSRFTPSTRRLVRAGALASVSAAAATVVFALVVKAIDVPLEVDGDDIPIPGFAIVTLLWSAVGIALALAFARWARRPARTFLMTTVVLTLGSFVPVLTADADTATQVALALSHLVAAAIVIPALTAALARHE